MSRLQQDLATSPPLSVVKTTGISSAIGNAKSGTGKIRLDNTLPAVESQRYSRLCSAIPCRTQQQRRETQNSAIELRGFAAARLQIRPTISKKSSAARKLVQIPYSPR